MACTCVVLLGAGSFLLVDSEPEHAVTSTAASATSAAASGTSGDVEDLAAVTPASRPARSKSVAQPSAPEATRPPEREPDPWKEMALAVAASPRLNPGGKLLTDDELERLARLLELLADPPASPEREISRAGTAHAKRLIQEGRHVELPLGQRTGLTDQAAYVHIDTQKGVKQYVTFDSMQVPEIARYHYALVARDHGDDEALRRFLEDLP